MSHENHVSIDEFSKPVIFHQSLSSLKSFNQPKDYISPFGIKKTLGNIFHLFSNFNKISDCGFDSIHTQKCSQSNLISQELIPINFSNESYNSADFLLKWKIHVNYQAYTSVDTSTCYFNSSVAPSNTNISVIDQSNELKFLAVLCSKFIHEVVNYKLSQGFKITVLKSNKEMVQRLKSQQGIFSFTNIQTNKPLKLVILGNVFRRFKYDHIRCQFMRGFYLNRFYGIDSEQELVK